jgi:hypothetical protein
MASIRLYGKSYVHLLKNEWSWDSGVLDIKGALMKSTYLPDVDADEYWDDISAYEITSGGATGYTAGGMTLEPLGPTYNTALNETVLDLENPLWEGITATARFLAIYKDTGMASTSPLIGIVDFGENKIATGQDLLINIKVDGLFRMQTAE